ncbi:MAG: hypothetical protein A2W93_03215 [Bacteroidetes bacterium GWF2_43_63]|nr:MAG: hypothetical protein A2W94_09215 [Bacteroidetes bacterium GWE2_42_42]OFY53670.1 MAG: hypothetical protein A2W93_03215 [Bacteroidetes bacterium GWF2_43_63]HBG70985.1 hypothetical protein [Bacteroidales bacterium]HCB62924.1 hypothetical protein [Bacteroidales bacterium]HCY24312.1 hypothetical protein [Bacteroidales bacterium]
MKYVCIVILACLFASCSPLVQKAYFVESPNVGAFDSAKVTSVDLSGNYYSNTELQYSHSFSEHIGISGGALLGYQGWTSNKSQHEFDDKPGPLGTYGLNAGLIWFRNSEPRYFELTIGYGYQYNNSRIISKWLTPAGMMMGPYLSHDVHSKFHRILIQPALLWKHNNGDKIGLVIRMELVNTPSFYYNYKLNSYYDSFNPHVQDYRDQISFYKKSFMVFSPFFFIRNSGEKFNIGMHVGLSLHTNVMSQYKIIDNLDSSLERNIIRGHPAMAAVVFGFDIGLNWKKK